MGCDFAKRSASLVSAGGDGEIRTHEGVSPSAVFKTAAFNRSATSPEPAPRGAPGHVALAILARTTDAVAGAAGAVRTTASFACRRHRRLAARAAAIRMVRRSEVRGHGQAKAARLG